MFAELPVSHELRKVAGEEAGIILRSTVVPTQPMQHRRVRGAVGE